ncbi:MAG TPA: AraC family transcriptional regulator [Solimonas sp.]
MTDHKHPAPSGVTIYYWPCSLVLLAPSLLLDRPTSPLCATLRIACRNPYTIEVDGRLLTTRASLVAPRAGRKKMMALNSDLALFYLPIDDPEYAGLKEVLGQDLVVDLPIAMFEHLLPRLRRAMSEVVDAPEIKALVREVVQAITGQHAAEPPAVDPRVTAACQVLDEMPLKDVSLEAVAEKVNLSSSRLRELFKKQTGFTIGEYARWRGVWRAALLWKRGAKLSGLAVEAGFYDMAHVDKAFNEVFGMNPSAVIDPRYVTLVSCE